MYRFISLVFTESRGHQPGLVWAPATLKILASLRSCSQSLGWGKASEAFISKNTSWSELAAGSPIVWSTFQPLGCRDKEKHFCH